jgi:hypothetical protein
MSAPAPAPAPAPALHLAVALDGAGWHPAAWREPRARPSELLTQLREATGADELIITTITHDHADRVRSYQLLAQEWERR